jgi:hypothetical protein
MDDSKQHAVKFLKKEIKTYAALSLFLSKQGIRHHVRVGSTTVLICPLFYRERITEAKTLVSDLKRAS